MSVPVYAVANYFLDRAADEGKPLTHMKLQKLAYIAHGWHLATTGRPLFPQRIEAWPYGPVIPDLYHDFKKYGNNPIAGRAMTIDFDTFDDIPYQLPPNPPAETIELLDRVWSAYKRHSATQLSTLTHQPGTPWDRVGKEAGTTSPRGLPISDELVRDHYVRLAAERRKARVG